uniref:Uncharacterized protein n=1 Tax=Micrurus paraensis TaxID=1970185 RepID=A0A2D4JW24_9SAUR
MKKTMKKRKIPAKKDNRKKKTFPPHLQPADSTSKLLSLNKQPDGSSSHPSLYFLPSNFSGLLVVQQNLVKTKKYLVPRLMTKGTDDQISIPSCGHRSRNSCALKNIISTPQILITLLCNHSGKLLMRLCK